MSNARVALVVAALAVLPLAGAPAAQADHITPSVTATVELGRAVKDCSLSGLCARARRDRQLERVVRACRAGRRAP